VATEKGYTGQFTFPLFSAQQKPRAHSDLTLALCIQSRLDLQPGEADLLVQLEGRCSDVCHPPKAEIGNLSDIQT
jgi:hypothetical protein